MAVALGRGAARHVTKVLEAAVLILVAIRSEAAILEPSTWTWQPFPLELARSATSFYQQPLVQLDFNKAIDAVSGSGWSPEALEDALRRGANGSTAIEIDRMLMSPALYLFMELPHNKRPGQALPHAEEALEILLRNGVSFAEGSLRVREEYLDHMPMFAVQNARCETGSGLSAFGSAAISMDPRRNMELAVALGADPFDPNHADTLLALAAHPSTDSEADFEAYQEVFDLLIDTYGFPIDGSGSMCPDGSPQRTAVQEAFEGKRYKTARLLVEKFGSKVVPELLKRRGLPVERPKDFIPDQDPEGTQLYQLLDARREAEAAFTKRVGRVRDRLRMVKVEVEDDPAALGKLQAVLNAAARLEQTRDPFSSAAKRSLQFLETITETWNHILDASDPTSQIGESVHYQTTLDIDLARERSTWAASCGQEGRLTQH